MFVGEHVVHSNINMFLVNTCERNNICDTSEYYMVGGVNVCAIFLDHKMN